MGRVSIFKLILTLKWFSFQNLKVTFIHAFWRNLTQIWTCILRIWRALHVTYQASHGAFQERHQSVWLTVTYPLKMTICVLVQVCYIWVLSFKIGQVLVLNYLGALIFKYGGIFCLLRTVFKMVLWVISKQLFLNLWSFLFDWVALKLTKGALGVILFILERIRGLVWCCRTKSWFLFFFHYDVSKRIKLLKFNLNLFLSIRKDPFC